MNSKASEVVLGVAIVVILFTITMTVAIPLLSSGIGSLIFFGKCTSTLFLGLFTVVGFIAFSDYPERIRKSKYLSGQAVLLAYTAFVLYLVFRFIDAISQFGSVAGFVIVGIVSILGLLAVIRAINHAILAVQNDNK